LKTDEIDHYKTVEIDPPKTEQTDPFGDLSKK